MPPEKRTANAMMSKASWFAYRQAGSITLGGSGGEDSAPGRASVGLPGSAIVGGKLLVGSRVAQSEGRHTTGPRHHGHLKQVRGGIVRDRPDGAIRHTRHRQRRRVAPDGP